jgi:hypothetical protein
VKPNWPLAGALQDFIDFTNAQKGAYSDACAGFHANTVEVGRQVAIVSKAAGVKVDKAGDVTVMRTSVEDPTKPDVIVHTIRLTSDFLAANGPEGRNEQQVCRAIIVFIFAYWDEEIRPRCAKLLGVDAGTLQLPVAGDVRLLRHAILHNSGVLKAKDHARLEVLGSLFSPEGEVILNHFKMTEIFRQLEKGFAAFAGHLLGLPEPPGGWAEVAQIVIPRPPPGAV